MNKGYAVVSVLGSLVINCAFLLMLTDKPIYWGGRLWETVLSLF